MTTAVIYVPPADFDRDALRCTEICKQEGWEIFGIIPTWDEAVGLKTSGKVDLIVVGRSDHIDPHNVPGIVVAAASPPGDVARPERRRPRQIRRQR